MAKLALILSSLALADAVSLSYVHASGGQADAVRGGSDWWAHVGDKVFYNPPTSMLSQDVSNHLYYSIGSHGALTDEMKQHRVGGDGRWHIFHLPEGPSMLRIETKGDRRHAFSSLAQLTTGTVLSKVFAEYKTSDGYVHPGGLAAEQKEKDAATILTADLFKEYLTKVTAISPDKAEQTRSYTNAAATNATLQFLHKEFSDLGLKSCLQVFGSGSNIVVYVPGSSRSTLTVGAHYDSRPFEGSAPGANDNGSGLSMLLAVAKAFTQAGFKPVRDMFLVGFAAEEAGLLGSEAFVPALLGTSGASSIPHACLPKQSFLEKRSAKRNHAAIILDEVGWKSPDLTAVNVNMESKDSSFDVLNHLAQANKLHNGGEVKATHSNNPFGSDHMSFIDHNLEGVLVINGDDEAYPAYHSSDDTMDKVDMDYAASLSKMVFGGIVRTAGLQN